MALVGVEPVKTKTTVDGKITEQVSTSKYTGCGISYWNYIDVEESLNRFSFFLLL
jgi:hypothetical protein